MFDYGVSLLAFKESRPMPKASSQGVLWTFPKGMPLALERYEPLGKYDLIRVYLWFHYNPTNKKTGAFALVLS